MHKLFKQLAAFVLVAALKTYGAEAAFTPLDLEGETFIHDPSTVIKDGPDYYVFGTGPGIRIKSSLDLIHWRNDDSVFSSPPAWTATAVPEFRGVFWAPDVIRVNGKFFL